MHTTHRFAFLTILAILLAITFNLSSAVPAYACNPRGTTYYSDATHREIVGQSGINCVCTSSFSWGITTPYWKSGPLNCPLPAG